MASGDKQTPTRGGDMLSRCEDSHAAIAEKVGVHKSLVTRWISGARKPSDDAHLARLEDIYRIPRAAWMQLLAVTPPRTGPSSVWVEAMTQEAVAELDRMRERDPGEAAGATAVGRGAPLPSPSPPARDRDGEIEGNNDRLHRFIREGIDALDADSETHPAKKADALKKLVDAQVSLDKSTGENAITMARIAQHPEFQRVVRLITEAVAPYPEAMAKVIEALRVSP